MKKFFPFRIPVLTLILALLVPAAFAQAAPEPTSATTPPPPIGFSILTVFDSNFDYLESGHANAAYVYSSYSNVPVESGYYYRTQAYHWINEGSRTESGYRYSATYLVP
ncbi:hypothetical protein [Paenibacillus jiagnxiensis]|uniref:hypothetical protein n=1 Tax=Paenibacillus jiagnxiensis TaxID=3228926 RepID=UPI00339F8DCF